MNCRECAQSNHSYGLSSCNWCGYGPFCHVCVETHMGTYDVGNGIREWECFNCQQYRCPEPTIASVYTTEWAHELTEEQLEDRRIIQDAEQKRVAAVSAVQRPIELEQEIQQQTVLRECKKCSAKEHHWCPVKKYICFKQCSGCGEYDSHDCTFQNRYITICNRCQCDDRMCFCC